MQYLSISSCNFQFWPGFLPSYCHLSTPTIMVWFDFNWDIVEPMTYFVGLGTTLVGYSFFLTYKSEYSYAAVQERQRKKFLRKLYLKNDFNWRRWNGLDVKIKGLVNYVGKENLPEHLKGIVPPEE
eukprot:TRINITY_DN1543_c0_g2_i1.p2 TRINITY_DN1543_c0_g2~~TRINITY_DN1543_c0_g2_i1.p2  ORF type:complete len:126 (-),score=18.87 TRINITY_DN1543_c0_g2_i1:56-433(-)